MRLILFSAVMAIAIMGVRLHRAQTAVRETASRSEILADSWRFVSTERSTLVDGLSAISRARWRTQPALFGTDVATGSVLAISVESADVVYVLDEACAACLQNLPLLDSLAREGVRVVAISHHGSRASLAAFQSARKIPYPVLVEPSGELADISNVFITPISLLFARGRIADVRVRRISRGELQLAKRARSFR